MDKMSHVVFIIEATAINGAYIHDLKQNYIIPTIEYFSQGGIHDKDFYLSDRTSSMYGIILYRTAQVGLGVSCLTHGPFSSPQKVLKTIDRLELTLTGGRSESNANLAEGMATALICFDDFHERREKTLAIHKHCILICNSPPYSMPVMDCYMYTGKNVEQLATIFQEKNIHLSIISSRKIPILFKIFEKAGGDLNQSTKNYCKDPRDLVLLKGYSLKELPLSPSTQSKRQISQLESNFMRFYSNEAIEKGILWDKELRPILSVVMDHNQQSNNMPLHFLNRQQTAAGFMVQPLATIVSGFGGHINSQLQKRHVCRSIITPTWMQAQQQQPHQFISNQLQQQPGQPPNPESVSSTLGDLSQQQKLQQCLINQHQTGLGSITLCQTQINPQQLGQPHQLLQNLSEAQQPHNQQGQILQAQQQATKREIIWTGVIEWWLKSWKMNNEISLVTRLIPCDITSSLKDGELDVKPDNWPSRLMMQLVPAEIISNVGGQYLDDPKTVVFYPKACNSLDSLSQLLSIGFAGCIYFNQCEIKIMILLFTNEKKVFLGVIPNDQNGFFDQLCKEIERESLRGFGQDPQQQSGPQCIQQLSAGNMPNTALPHNPQMMQMVQTSSSQMQLNQNQHAQEVCCRIGLKNMPGIQQKNLGNSNQIQNMLAPLQQRVELDGRQQSNMNDVLHLKSSLQPGYDAYDQIPKQIQDNKQTVQQQHNQPDEYERLQQFERYLFKQRKQFVKGKASLKPTK